LMMAWTEKLYLDNQPYNNINIMNTKLDNITTQYRKFNASQALTEGQLNEFIDYFEDQDRLSRTRLSGVGIVCGFESSLYPVGSNAQLQNFTAINISQGAGITTDGDLVTLRKKNDNSKDVTIDFASKSYTYCRSFLDKAGYPYFIENNIQVPLLELFTDQEYEDLVTNGEDTDDFERVNTIAGINNKIIIIYLESYANEGTPCEEADCDNNGVEQVADLKVLLADKDDVSNYIIKKDSIYNLYNTYEVLYDELKDIEVPRVILNTNITTEPGVRAKFQAAVQNSSVITGLVEGFTAIADTFGVNMGLGNQSLNDKLAQLLSTTSDDYQYRYDLLKDLVDTYNEIRSLLLHLKSVCCPGIASFSKHLMLGPVGASLSLGNLTEYRHDFYNSPISTDADENQERLLLLANRFAQKINAFQTFSGPVKITPSNLNVTLGKKAIPFYYNVNDDLLKKWDFERTETGKEAYNLSYHTDNLSDTDFVQNPLLYNIDDYDFYRIEGHLGMPYKIALQNINDLRSAYGLAFDVVPLVLKKGKTNSSNTLVSELSSLSIKDLRSNLVTISRSVSNQLVNKQTTLKTISLLDEKLRLLNDVELASGSEISLVKQSTKEDDVVAELLSELLERNSGLEHFAGVPKGGTFYLIYAAEDSDEVIADFAVPYLCCSKKDPVFLVLPATQLCQNDTKIPITILPLDGEVKAYVGNTQITGVTQSGGQNYFDPSLVTSQNLGQTITFTVNDDPVDTHMVVNAQPNVTVVVDEPVYGEDPDAPKAEVTFNISTGISDLTYVLNFGDGASSSGTIPLEGKQIIHPYQLVAGQEDVFNPVLTVSNKNGCSTQYNLDALTLVGQSTVECLSSMDVVIQYNTTKGPCPGGHTCNAARFNLLANGIPLGLVNLNNASQSLETGQARPDGETSGPNRISTISITPAQAQQIASANQPNDGFISFSLVCADNTCHTGVAWTTLKLNGLVIYSGCPTNNFLTINPCTGEIRP
jgi:hypothetical protein